MAGVTSPQVLSPALKASIERLYRVFGSYPLRQHIEGCPCGCLPTHSQAVLHSAPLRALTADDLSRFTYKTMTTWGDEVDFKHFLPRLLELLAQGSLSEMEILLGKLAYAGWWSWPGQEFRAGQAFLQAWWGDVLAREHTGKLWDGCEVATVLGGIAQAERDLTPYLIHWDETETSSALLQLAAFVLTEAEGLIDGRMAGVYWKDQVPQARQVRHWLLAGRQQARLEAASEQETGPQREMLRMAAYTLSVASS